MLWSLHVVGLLSREALGFVNWAVKCVVSFKPDTTVTADCQQVDLPSNSGGT